VGKLDQESKPGRLRDVANGQPGISRGMFNPLRHFALRSFVSILVAAVLLTAFYRHLEIKETTEFARKSNLALAEALLDSFRLDLGEYLETVTNLGPQAISTNPFPPQLAVALTSLSKKMSLTKVQVYNKKGVVVFSTDRHEIGSLANNESGFVSASKGQAVSDLSYRDAFSIFGQQQDEDNLMRTFLPVQLGAGKPVWGALATFEDLNPTVAQSKREILAIIGGMALILSLLYSVLLLVVMQAKKVIDAQQETIRERTSILETLSVQLIADEEAEKSRLAASLHDGLAQTLSAIKSQIEQSLERQPADIARNETLNIALSGLQGAIEEAQELATELRPSSLDELGLLPTISWYCREFQYLHPDIQIEQQVLVQEQDIPKQLKTVIYRIVEAVLKDIGEHAHRDRIRLSLQPSGNAIILSVDDIPQEPLPAMTLFGAEDRNLKLRFAAAQERATLSGGAFSAVRNREGGVTLQASWAT
jgi:signal transduction histidine kinase